MIVKAKQQELEYRVNWRRSSWSDAAQTKSRIFQRKHDADRFLAKLLGDDQPDLGQVDVVVTMRTVGEWHQ